MITILPPHVAALIAAGEVIHSPRDILKELIENALDASATVLDISMLYGGIEHIGVRDNGPGMSESDLAQATFRHATSKITSIEDLSTLSSFGFRGEGLYSIASICNFTMRSRIASMSLGSEIVVRLPDRKLEQKPCSMNIGTQVICDHIFAPIPVRRKMLKNHRLELKRSLEMIRSLTLMQSHVSVRVTENNELVFKLLPVENALLERLVQAYPLTDIEKWRYNSFSFDQGRIEGWYYPESTKGLEQSWYLNERWFEQRIFTKLAQRYTDRGILLIKMTLNTELVDFNIHPQKHQFGFYKQDALLSSLGDFFLDWIGMNCESVSDVESFKEAPFLPNKYPHFQEKGFAGGGLGGGRAIYDSHRETAILKSSAVNSAETLWEPMPQIVFLEQQVAFIIRTEIILFDPQKLLHSIVSSGSMQNLIEPISLQGFAHENFLAALPVKISNNHIIAIPSEIDRYMLLHWLQGQYGNDQEGVLRLYDACRDMFLKFFSSVHDIEQTLIKNGSFLGRKSLKELTKNLTS